MGTLHLFKYLSKRQWVTSIQTDYSPVSRRFHGLKPETMFAYILICQACQGEGRRWQAGRRAGTVNLGAALQDEKFR